MCVCVCDEDYVGFPSLSPWLIKNGIHASTGENRGESRGSMCTWISTWGLKI